MQKSKYIPDWMLVQQYLQSRPSIFFYWGAEAGWPVIFVSENISQIGYSAQQFISKEKKFSDIVHQDDLARVVEEVQDYAAKKVNSFTQEYRLLTAEGEVCWVDDRTVTQCATDGTVMHYLGIITDITERIDVEKAFRLSQEKFRALVESTHDFVWEVDRDGHYTYCSPQVETLLGYASEQMLGKKPFEFMTIEDALSIAEKFKEFAAKKQAFSSLENTNIHRDGQEIVLETSGVPFFDSEGELAGYRGIDRDITERKLVQQRLAVQQEFLQSVIDGVHDSIMVIDEDCNIQLMNQSAKSSVQGEFILNRKKPKCYEVSHLSRKPCHGDDRPCPLREVVETGEAVKLIHKHLEPAGSAKFIELIASPLRDENGTIHSIIEITRDVTSQLSTLHELEEQKAFLHKLAHHDPLTGLPNRLLFLDRLKQAIKKAHRNNGQLAVLFIDLDRFKQINDSLGHSMGDAVLKAVAGRLRNCLREDDVVARLGGDEFTIMMEAVHHVQHIAKMAQKIIGIVQSSVTHEGHELYVSGSVGIALYPQDGEDAEVLLRNADTAMYRAKSEKENRFQFYTSDMTELAFERVLMESQLHRALRNDQFIVLYQPQVDLRTDSLVGFEALVRWRHPDLGLLLPSKFISLAEDTGLILRLGERVLRLACGQMASWYEAGLRFGKVAVNVTAKQLGDDRFMPMVERILEESGCRPHWLELEITESVIMQQQERAIQLLQRLKKLGIELAIDDFGTGYSSLALLKRLPVSKLKIDRSFIRDIPGDDSDNAITCAVIAMGRSMGLRVIAEGVENSEQTAFLKEHGCDEAQGYLFDPPLPAHQVAKRLTTPAD